MSAKPRYLTPDERFAEQFTPDGAGFIYRKSRTGEAKPVSLTERDRFAATFKYRRQYLKGATWAGTLLLLFFFAIQPPFEDSADVRRALVVGVFTLFGAWFIIAHLLWTAPARALRQRPAIAAALSRKEKRQLRLERLTYGQLVLLALSGFWLEGQLTLRGQAEWGAWDAVGLAIAAGSTAFAAVQAFGKWRMERAQNPAITSRNAGP